MKSTDPRDSAWLEIQSRLTGLRSSIYEYLWSAGPSTTSEIAEGTGIPLLTVRPRVSELAAWGFARCVERRNREGVYQAITIAAARAAHAEAERRETQLPLLLP